MLLQILHILACVLIGCVVGVLVYYFTTYAPISTQTATLKEWLKYAVTLAEKELGSGTGQLKLRYVYEMFLGKFTWLAKHITFEAFSNYVDEALEWMRKQLSDNSAVSTLVYGSTEEETETGGGASAIGFEYESTDMLEDDLDIDETIYGKE